MNEKGTTTQFSLPLGVRPDTGEEVSLPIGPEGSTLLVVGQYGCGKTALATKLANRLAENPGDRVTVIAPPYHAGYADLARAFGGMHVDLTEGEQMPEGAEEAPFLSVALSPASEDDGFLAEIPWGALQARLPSEGRPSHLLVDPLHGLLDRFELIALMTRWANTPVALEAAGIDHGDAVETASVVAATVSPYVAFRLPERFGTLLLMRSRPEQVTDKTERTVFGPILTGKIVTKAWFRYEIPDDALPLEHLALLPVGEGVLVEISDDGALRQTPLFVDLRDEERQAIGLPPAPRRPRPPAPPDGADLGGPGGGGPGPRTGSEEGERFGQRPRRARFRLRDLLSRHRRGDALAEPDENERDEDGRRG